MRKQGVIIFDFDGVMADTFEMCFQINHMVFPTLTRRVYRSRFEGNIYEAKMPMKPTGKIDYFTEYEPRVMRIPLRRGVARLLRLLSKRYKLIIISSTAGRIIRKYLKHFGVDHYFKAILGPEIATSKVVKIRLVLKKFKIDQEKCIFITDTLGDIKEANTVGIPCVAVTWGYHSRATLKKGEPRFLVNKIGDIPKLIRGYFSS